MDALRELADAYGVSTEYWDWRGQHVNVPDNTLESVLAALDVDTSDPLAALRAKHDQPWRTTLPPYVVARTGESATVTVHVTAGESVDVWVTLEDGSYHSNLRQIDNHEPPRELDGRWVGAAGFELAPTLPLGYHQLHAHTSGTQYETPLIITPAWLGLPTRTGDNRLWGLATQLYSVRSHGSWGIGDLTDLAELATWAGTQHDAGFVLVNPLHAAEPVTPMQPSPYLPTSRRYANPIYLRIERIAEYATLPDRPGRPTTIDNSSDFIDRDVAWTAKHAALENVHRAGREPGRELAYQAYRDGEGAALQAFAIWCVLVERHGMDWHDWPAELHHPQSRQVAQFAAQHPDEIDFHCWLQWLLDEQFADAQATARRAGMALGIVHDLAVGVSPTGADAWVWQDEMGRGITVGAPPDAYAQTGQNWNQPPWRPDRLAELAYAPLRELIATALRHSGGLRVDHIIGLFRLWWIPTGAPPTEGTYVRYDHDASIGILALEAARADAVVVGEDLGTVEPWVRDYLRSRGLLGTSVLWFENDYDGGGGPIVPELWREYCLASVTTHDLPPTAGYLAGDHVRLRDELGLLTRSMQEELAADRAEQSAWLDVLRSWGLLAADSAGDSTEDAADSEQTVLALHQALAAAPSRLLCLALTDAVGDRRTQNQPGANVGYPNWQVPLTDAEGRPVHLEDVFTSERAAALAEALRSRPEFITPSS